MKRFLVPSAIVALVAVGVVVIVLRPWQSESATDKDRKLDSGAATNLAGDAEVQALIQQREQLDRTVWADEIQAQQHEMVFVRLWDALRSAPDAYAVARAFQCQQIVLGVPGAYEDLGADVEIARTGPDSIRLDGSTWLDWLSEQANAGYHLAQSEWHHEAFHPASAGKPARSTVAMVLHVDNQRDGRRWQIEGHLEVEWGDIRTPSDYRIRHIDASRLVFKRRAGLPSFVPLFSADLGLSEGIANWSDILVYDLQGDEFPEIAHPATNRLFRNNAQGEMRETALCGHPLEQVTAALFGDFTADGQVDLLCAGSINRSSPQSGLWLFAGDADGRFPDRPISAQAEPLRLEIPDSLAAGDIDLDGDLDVFLTQYKQPYRNGQMPTPYYDANDGWPAFLLINNGSGVFHDGTKLAGLAPKRHRRTYRSSFVDLDDDGDLDLLVTSDFAGLDIYHNDGTGNFTDVSQRVVDERANFGMSHALADFDGDGRLDFYVTGMASTTARRLQRLGLGREEFPQHQAMRPRMGYGNRMYLRAEGDAFSQPPLRDQVARSGWSWGCGAADFDCDGDVDIYIANGHRSGRSSLDYCSRFWCHDIYFGQSQENDALYQFFASEARHIGGAISWNGYEKNHLFLNQDGSRFDNVAFLMGIAQEADCRHVAVADFDRDGRPDLLIGARRIVAGQDHLDCQVWRNVLPGAEHWVGIDLFGTKDVSPLGAKVTVITPSRRFVSTIVAGDSFAVQQPTTAHFGLGKEHKILEIHVIWPGGWKTVVSDPIVDQYQQVMELSATGRPPILP